MFILGAKVAGVKILVPWTNPYFWMKPEDQYETEEETSTSTNSIGEQIKDGLKHVFVTVCFMGSCYLYTRYLVKQREQEIEKWLTNSLEPLQSR